MPNKFKRETAVRTVSRGGDLAIANGLIFFYGESWFLYATVAGALWNFTADLFGQRKFVYNQPSRQTKTLLEEAIPYALLRLAVAGIGFGALSFLFFVCTLPYYVASITTTLLMWKISYKTTKMFFTGL